MIVFGSLRWQDIPVEVVDSVIDEIDVNSYGKEGPMTATLAHVQRIRAHRLPIASPRDRRAYANAVASLMEGGIISPSPAFLERIARDIEQAPEQPKPEPEQPERVVVTEEELGDRLLTEERPDRFEML